MEIYYALFFIFGLCIGSFCNVLIYRMPLGKSINFPASHCPSCKHKLKFYHNIPLISWIFLRGKCAFCKQNISFIYLIVELASALLAMAGLFIAGNLISGAVLGLCLIVLLALSVIDFRHHAVPESLLLVVYFLAIFSHYDGEFRFDEISLFYSSIVVSFIFAGAITIIKSITSAWINRHSNGEILETMGDADTIIIASIGAILGIKLGIFAVFLAGILQIILHIILRIISHKNHEAPFIPALSVSLLLVLLFQNQALELFELYFKFIGLK